METLCITLIVQVEYDMEEEPSQERGLDDDLEEHFVRSKWMQNCTEAAGLEDSAEGILFASAQRQRASCNPSVLEEQA